MIFTKTVKTKELFDLTKSRAGEWLAQFEHPWEALAGIKEFLLALGPTLPVDEFGNPVTTPKEHNEDVNQHPQPDEPNAALEPKEE